MFQGLVAAGRARRLPVVIHSNTKTGQRMAVGASADVITHTIADGVGGVISACMPKGNGLCWRRHRTRVNTC
jgi:hypothetical protein